MLISHGDPDHASGKSFGFNSLALFFG